MEDITGSPISTLKVDFGCTKGCPMDVKNMLQQLKGVKSISVDPNEGKVTVTGDINPMMLVKLFQKMGKKAQLCSFIKSPRNNRAASSHPKHKHSSHCCCESSDSESEDKSEFETAHHHHHDGARYGTQRSKKMHVHKQRDMFGFGNRHAPITGYHHPPMSGYHHHYQPPFSGYYYPPPMPRYQLPVAYTRPPSTYLRPNSLYGYYGQGQPVRPTYRHYNPMIHYTSYEDNYRYTL